MKHLKWSGIIVTTVFLALAQQACGVDVDDEQDQTSNESAVTGEAHEALTTRTFAQCSADSDCVNSGFGDPRCINGTCVDARP